MDSPQQYNALGSDLLAERGAALDASIADAELRSTVLTGAGDGFCSRAQFGSGIFESREAV